MTTRRSETRDLVAQRIATPRWRVLLHRAWRRAMQGDLSVQLVLVSAAAAAALTALIVREPARVDLRVENQTGFLLYVMASTPSDPSLSPVGALESFSDHEFDDVIDRGNTWRLHLRTRSGHEIVIDVDRADLAAVSGYVIAESVGDELRERGAPADVADE